MIQNILLFTNAYIFRKTQTCTDETIYIKIFNVIFNELWTQILISHQVEINDSIISCTVASQVYFGVFDARLCNIDIHLNYCNFKEILKGSMRNPNYL